LSMDPEHGAKKSLIKIQRKLRKVIAEPGFSYNKGIEYYMEGKYNLAIGQWEKALILEPGYKRASQYIQKTQEKLKEMAKAERAQERGREITQHYKNGCNLYQAGNMKGAMKEFQAVLRLNPNHKGAQEYLAKIGTSLAPKEKPLAGEEPTVVAEPKPGVDPAEIAEHYNKGLEAYQNGQLTAALKEWEKVLELDPNNEKAQRNIEEVRKELEAVEKK
jgi:tetratricopeptide (TPR) repeat protein